MPQFTGLQNSDFPLLLLQTLPAFLTTCCHAPQVSPTPSKGCRPGPAPCTCEPRWRAASHGTPISQMRRWRLREVLGLGEVTQWLCPLRSLGAPWAPAVTETMGGRKLSLTLGPTWQVSIHALLPTPWGPVMCGATLPWGLGGCLAWATPPSLCPTLSCQTRGWASPALQSELAPWYQDKAPGGLNSSPVSRPQAQHPRTSGARAQNRGSGPPRQLRGVTDGAKPGRPRSASLTCLTSTSTLGPEKLKDSVLLQAAGQGQQACGNPSLILQ